MTSNIYRAGAPAAAGQYVAVQAGPGVLARVATSLSRVIVRPVIAAWAHLWTAPWPYSALDVAASVLPAVRGTSRVRVHLRNCDAEFSRPANPGAAGGAILYLHGGAWLVGGLRSHRRLVSRLARSTGMPVLAVNYRKLPRTSISAALEDCIDGYRRLLATGVSPDRIALVGDSAGGYFAAQVTLQAMRRGLGTPGALACISPLIDPHPHSKLTGTPVSDPLFPPSAFRTIWEMAMAAETDPAAATELLRYPAQACGAQLAAMPPTLIQVGGGEILRADSEGFAARLAEAGCDVRLEIYPGQIHVFQAGADLLPEARRAISSIAGHIVDSLGRSVRDAA